MKNICAYKGALSFIWNSSHIESHTFSVQLIDVCWSTT